MGRGSMAHDARADQSRAASCRARRSLRLHCAPMTRFLRLGCLTFLATTSLAALGCGTATTLEDIDSGVPASDTGGAQRDTGLTTLGDGSMTRDAASGP